MNNVALIKSSISTALNSSGSNSISLFSSISNAKGAAILRIPLNLTINKSETYQSNGEMNKDKKAFEKSYQRHYCPIVQFKSINNAPKPICNDQSVWNPINCCISTYECTEGKTSNEMTISFKIQTATNIV